jgi:hypothetical protein
MTDLPSWAEGIKQESLEKALAAGEILPNLPLPDIPRERPQVMKPCFLSF